MDTYTLLRHFADSWMLLAMVLAFLGVVLWTLRPGSAPMHRDTAEIPLRNDRLPGSEHLPGPEHLTDAAAATDRSTER